MPGRRGPDVYFDFTGNQGAVSICDTVVMLPNRNSGNAFANIFG